MTAPKKIVDPRYLRRPPKLSDFQTPDERIDAAVRKMQAQLDKLDKLIKQKQAGAWLDEVRPDKVVKRP